MNTNYIINELKINKNVIKELLSYLEAEIIFWRPSPSKWCLLEIICHLYDEEKEDFRKRLRSTLENPQKPFDPIDPVGWVESRHYIKQDFNLKLKDFLDERDKSIDYLYQLDEPNWQNFYIHPKLGKLSAKLFFTNWLAHDYLHIRQITKLKYDYLSSIAEEKLNYAGNW